MKKRGIVISGVVVALCAVTAAVTLGRAATPHYTFKQAMSSPEGCQVYGKLVKESVRMERGMTRVHFDLIERDGNQRMTLLYDNPSYPVQANFATASDVRATGVYNPRQGVFVAEQLYTKCPSKYESSGYKAEQGGAPDPTAFKKPAGEQPAAPATGN